MEPTIGLGWATTSADCYSIAAVGIMGCSTSFETEFGCCSSAAATVDW
jgi:hypothetical protein